jgi:DMSO/TMAO reductase YedYZ molybdopterin-dependent catalytic subunit
MKHSRRSFIKLIPVGGAVAAASWFLSQRTSSPSVTVNPSATTAVSEETFDFPVTWNVDQPINVDPKDYRLRVDGNVSNPIQLTLEELYTMPLVNENSMISCVEGWNTTVTWEGVRLSHLLSLAGAPSDFDHVTVESITGYTTQINQKDIHSGIIIAVKAFNGKGSVPLKVEHGYPARLVLPKTLGLAWVKYVGKITCTKP